MQEQLRNELDEIVTAAEALPLARDKEDYWRTLAEQLAGDLSSARRRCGRNRIINFFFLCFPREDLVLKCSAMAVICMKPFFLASFSETDGVHESK